MNIQHISQYSTMVMSLLIMFATGIGFWLKPHKRFSLCVWFIVGLLDFTFYFWILCSGLVDISIPTKMVTEVSAARSLVRGSLIATWLWFWNFKNMAYRRTNGWMKPRSS